MSLIFSQISWGKIVALFAFGARLAQHCSDNLGMNDLVFDIATNLADFAVRKLTPFLRQNGGWATLCDAFPMESDYESKIWRTLLLTGIGLTTVAAIVSLQRWCLILFLHRKINAVIKWKPEKDKCKPNLISVLISDVYKIIAATEKSQYNHKKHCLLYRKQHKNRVNIWIYCYLTYVTKTNMVYLPGSICTLVKNTVKYSWSYLLWCTFIHFLNTPYS